MTRRAARSRVGVTLRVTTPLGMRASLATGPHLGWGPITRSVMATLAGLLSGTLG